MSQMTSAAPLARFFSFQASDPSNAKLLATRENVNTEKFPWHGKTAKSPKVSIVFVEAELVPDQLAILPFPLEDGPFQTITCMSYST